MTETDLDLDPITSPWFFINFLQAKIPQTITSPKLCVIENPDLMHHFRVMRLQANEPIVLVDEASGQAVQAQLTNVTKFSMTFKILSSLPNPPVDRLQLTMAVALIKQSAWDWMLQKLTELGVYQIVPLETERSVIKLADKHSKMQRWREIIRHAGQQSEQRHLPYLFPPCSLKELIELQGALNVQHRWIAQERLKGKTSRDLPPILNPEPLIQTATPQAPVSVMMAVGPEGGWTPPEAEFLVKQGYEPVSLGTSILRAETAAIYGASVIRYATQKP